ncbi:MAG TPA: tRNA lysidine(34) synthetase TilS, partial [Aquabacterium sp.]|nr:tRNA lysidine(34) synthetase TilS [Aquabacterium sp.]
GLDALRLVAREPAERRELLRHWYLGVSGQTLSRSWVQRLDRELPRAVEAGHPAQWPEVAVGLYRGVVSWHGGGAPTQLVGRTRQLPAGVRHLVVDEPGQYTAPGWLGVLSVEKVTGDEPGVPWSLLTQLSVGERHGGEDFQMAANRPARQLKKQFQAAGVPAWMRNSPLFFSGGRLVFVPGLGMDARVLVIDPAQSRARLTWLSLPSKGCKG